MRKVRILLVFALIVSVVSFFSPGTLSADTGKEHGGVTVEAGSQEHGGQEHGGATIVSKEHGGQEHGGQTIVSKEHGGAEVVVQEHGGTSVSDHTT